jgi:hypothetical protein
MLGQDVLQRAIDAVRVHIPEAKRDHARQRGSTGGKQFPNT